MLAPEAALRCELQQQVWREIVLLRIVRLSSYTPCFYNTLSAVLTGAGPRRADGRRLVLRVLAVVAAVAHVRGQHAARAAPVRAARAVLGA